MRARNIKTSAMGYASSFNTSTLDEIIVHFDDGDADSDYIKNYEVLINGKWMLLNEAFRLGLVETDDYNKYFYEVPNTGVSLL